MKITKAVGKMLLGIIEQLETEKLEAGTPEENVYNACRQLRDVLVSNVDDLPSTASVGQEPLTIGQGPHTHAYVEIRQSGDKLAYFLHTPTKTGEVRACPTADPFYPGMYLCYASDGEDIEIDLACAESREGPDDPEPEGITVYLWENVFDEDWTTCFQILDAEAREAINDL